jgi:glutaminyl-peptide cyclotransferase
MNVGSKRVESVSFVLAFLLTGLVPGIVLTALAALGLMVNLYSEPRVQSLRVEVLSVHPHDAHAFTQGLLIQDGRMFESTGLYGQSSLREIASASGEVLRSIPLDARFFGEGLAAVDHRLIQLTWRENTALVYDRETFTEIGRFTFTGEGWGLCYDGTQLAMSDGSDTIVFRSPENFNVLRSIKVTLNDQPVPRLNELEFAGGFLYANVWQEDSIVKIDPATGKVVAIIDASGLLTPEEDRSADVLNGIAYDPATGDFYLTGKLWPKLFRVRWVES